MALPALALFAQNECDRIGWVASITPGCGAKLLDMNNGEFLHVVEGAEALTGGQTVRFSSIDAPLPAGCPSFGFTTVALTCVSDTLPCTVYFQEEVNPLNSFNLTFFADIYDENVQECTWTFGDGSTGFGGTVQHTFATEGVYQVCVTMTGPYGCDVVKCRNIYVSEQNESWCDYDIYLTTIGNQLFGKLQPLSGNAGILQSIEWVNSKTHEVLANTQNFTYALPGPGTYQVCADYVIKDEDDADTCSTRRCQQVIITEPGCINPNLIDPSPLCPTFFAPVCGCNGTTYANECEALASGITSWWAGPCGTANTGTCSTDFEMELVSGSPDQGYTVRFKNLSVGDIVQLDFGDGSPIYTAAQWDTVSHFYPHGGVYRANMTAWKSNSCVSSLTKLLLTGSYSIISDLVTSEITDYVLPGDANGDLRANVFDVLNLGVGFYSTGSPRPDATTQWTPQFAPNWANSVATGVNFKHLDCDGDGIILDFDRQAIQQHYIPIDHKPAPVVPGTPEIWIDFPQDTILLSANFPLDTILEVEADIHVGTPSNPAPGVYGLAFGLAYPEYVEHDPQTEYVSEYLGSSNDILWLDKDNYNLRQLDLGFVRKLGQSYTGNGRIAHLKLRAQGIIIIDIMAREDSKVVPFHIDLLNIRAIDEEGNEFNLSSPETPDTLWVKLLQTTGTGNPSALDAQVKLFPNPASDFTTVYLGNLKADAVEALNPLGQRIYRQETEGEHNVRVNVESWPAGVYTLRIFTDAGVVEKRLIRQ
jgi:PKD repeat protein